MTDEAGAPVSGIPVQWAAPGAGSVAPALDSTGADGRSSARHNQLDFDAAEAALTVTAPASPDLAPTGHYLLFVLNRNGVPSNGKVIGIR
jgi:hypothetical protein